MGLKMHRTVKMGPNKPGIHRYGEEPRLPITLHAS